MMMSKAMHLILALPAFIVLVTACLALLGDLFFKHRCQSVAYGLSLVGLALATLASFFLLNNQPEILFSGHFIADDLGQLATLFILIAGLFCFGYTKSYLKQSGVEEGDYYVLGLLSILGMMLLVSAYSLLSIFLSLELLSLPLYTLTAIRRTLPNSTEAALKYFVMGAVATSILLYGFSLLYGATGQIGLGEIAKTIHTQLAAEPMLLHFALVLIITGIGFKLAAVPYHMWAPDVYEGAPTSVTAFISAGPKIAALIMGLRFLSTSFVDLVPVWQQMLLVLALLSTGLGNLLALVQTNLKRLFAYSAIAHVGYALFGLLAATHDGYVAAVYYIVVYALMAVAAFGLLLILSQKGTEITTLSDLKGLNQRSPWIAFLMMIVLFSMAGVPPTVGFFTKLLVLKSLVDVQLTWVAVLGLVFAVVGAYYYIRIIMVMYFEGATDNRPVCVTKTGRALFSLNALMLLYFGIFPAGLIRLCQHALGS